MRAIQMARPEAGAAVLVDDLQVPTAGPGEVRVRVLNTAICGTDRHIYHWDPSVAPMMRPPVTIGHEFCGTIVAVGDKVLQSHVGDFVSAESHVTCGMCYQCRTGQAHM